MAFHAHTGEALAFVSAHTGELISATARAHERAGPSRLTHLFEAHRLALEIASKIGNAIQAEQAACGAAAAPIIAARIRAVAEGGR